MGEIERLPMIALIYRLRGTTEIFQMIEGNVSLDELMSRLITAQETYQSQLSLEIKEEEKDEGQPVSKLRFRIPITVDDDNSDEESKAKNPDRPNGIVSGASTSANNQIERRFLASETLQTVLDYLTTEGFSSSDFKVLSSWPRRDLTTLDTTQTLKSLKLYPQETLILEEK